MTMAKKSKLKSHYENKYAWKSFLNCGSCRYLEARSNVLYGTVDNIL